MSERFSSVSLDSEKTEDFEIIKQIAEENNRNNQNRAISYCVFYFLRCFF